MYALDYKNIFIDSVQKFKTLEFAVDASKKWEFFILRLLYEWVENENDGRKSILVSEVREHAGLLLGEEFGKYKKFEELSKRMESFLNLKAVRIGGRKFKCVAKK